MTVCVLGATPTVRNLYNDAVAREQAVRAAMTPADAPQSVVNAVRSTVARYEAVVRHYPASSYCDNALWQAARLSLDAYTKFGQAEDKEAGTRLLKQLASMYPTSKLAAQVPAQLARLASDVPLQPRVMDSPRPTVAEAPPLAVAPPPPPVRLPERTERAPERPERPTEPPRAAERTSLTTIKEIRRSVLADAVRIVIELDGEVEFRQDRIDGPPRVFVDLPSTRAAVPLVDRTIRFEGDADVVRQIRVGRHPNNTTRVVLDAAGVSSYSVYPLYGPFRLVIDCVRQSAAVATTGLLPSASPAAVRTPMPPPLVPEPPPLSPPKPATPATLARREPARLPAHALTSEWLRSAPGIASQHTVLIAEARAPELPPGPPVTAVQKLPGSISPSAAPPKLPAVVPAPGLNAGEGANASAPAKANELPGVATARPADPAAPPAAKNGGGGFSIARQLGLGVSRIVIDAGHGGHDPGAQARGVVEAELVLDIALRVEKLLQKTAGVEVLLTRRTDEFIALQERTAMANREGADLFLSIHANASSSTQAHGIETYFLNFASNLSAAAVAARENAASGQAMNALPDIVKAIALNNKLDESRDFATQVQHAMVEHLRNSNKAIKDLGVKQAPFVVLIGAAMPSVLAEISFVTNPQEAKLLKSGNYRQRIAEALVNAIRKYQASLKSTTTVAQ